MKSPIHNLIMALVAASVVAGVCLLVALVVGVVNLADWMAT